MPRQRCAGLVIQLFRQLHGTVNAEQGDKSRFAIFAVAANGFAQLLGEPWSRPAHRPTTWNTGDRCHKHMLPAPYVEPHRPVLQHRLHLDGCIDECAGLVAVDETELYR